MPGDLKDRINNLTKEELVYEFNLLLWKLEYHDVRIYDEENCEYYITGVELNQKDEKIYFKTQFDEGEE